MSVVAIVAVSISLFGTHEAKLSEVPHLPVIRFVNFSVSVQANLFKGAVYYYYNYHYYYYI
jgi:hypothetical protein